MSKQEIKNDSIQNSSNNKSIELIELEQELISLNPNIFQGLTPKKKNEILRSISISTIQERSHSGPLPDADTLVKYNSVIPEGADRIMIMAEKQQKHRMELENLVIPGHAKQSRLGQWFGLVIGLFGIGCGTFLAYTGHETVGGIIAGGTVVSLVSVFVIGKTIQKSNN